MKKYKFKRYHISYLTRVLFILIILIFSVSLGIYYLYKSINFDEEEKYFVNEVGNVDYSVCLKNNDFFENNCLNENMTYVASLINNIPLNFIYKLNTNIQSDIDIAYEIKAKLIINNGDNNKKYYEKEYTLLENTITKKNVINENVDIDYDYYNKIANKFKTQYGVDVNSFLEVYLIAKKDGLTDSKISMNIPLSQSSIDIKLNTSIIDKTEEKIIKDKDLIINNRIKLVCGTLLLLFSMYYLVLLVKLLLIMIKKYNKYDKMVAKILKTYDRLVVNTTSFPRLDDYDVLKISSFEELLDVRDNLRLPIMYYVVKEHEKCHFYILHNNNIYLYTLKAVDLV